MEGLELRELRQLARLYNVQTSYYDVFGRQRKSSPEGILKVLQALGAAVERREKVSDALRERMQSLWQQGIDPVIVAWDGEAPRLRLRLPLNLGESPVHYQIRLESGDYLRGSCPADGALLGKAIVVEGQRYVTRLVALPEKFPYGYHEVLLQTEKKSFNSVMISAPTAAYVWPKGEAKAWGIFLPLYALRSERSWGAGDFSDLERLVDWVKGLGGQVIGTLPLLATFLDSPFDPSPYSSVSRLFWNEFYVDVNRAPELRDCPASRSLLGSSYFQTEIEKLRSAPLVDYRQQMALKRAVMEELARWLFNSRPERLDTLERFVAANPAVEDYARFRAATERLSKPWSQWPEANREGSLSPGDYDEGAKNYHLYAQWLAHEQLKALGAKTRQGGPALYLDFPLGVHRDGYDVWRERSAFALEVSGGAPPDEYFTKGQDWGFPPLHPIRLREQGYRYFIASLRQQLNYAGLLRIDHVMGLHRLFWVPQGMEPRDGVYVRYPASEFYAILSLESHRHRALVVGENLGTVAPSVNAHMARHKILGMYVGQFAVSPDPHGALGEVPEATVASLNTHDTATFCGFWRGHDIEDRLELGLLSAAESRKERMRRQALREALTRFLMARGRLENESGDPGEVLKAWLIELAKSPAELVLINLEDLWLEERAQNVPATWTERPNWQRKARYSLEEFCQMTDLVQTLKDISQRRKD